jgi:ABC-2 type transport system permease protein
VKITLVALAGEIRKSLLTAWTYRMNSLAALLTMSLVFVAISFMMTGGSLDAQELAPTYLGFITWMYAMMAIGNVAYGVRGEMSAGTLEQMAMSPAPLSILVLGRVVANLLVTTVQVVLVSVGLRYLAGIGAPMNAAGVLVLLLTLFGILGFGFLIAGAVLIWKQVESLANLVQNVLLFLNGSLLPVSQFPPWLTALSHVFPSTQGIIVLRRVTLGEQSLLSVWQDGSLVWLIVHSALFLLAGWIVFVFCERAAKRQGSLGQY